MSLIVAYLHVNAAGSVHGRFKSSRGFNCDIGQFDFQRVLGLFLRPNTGGEQRQNDAPDSAANRRYH